MYLAVLELPVDLRWYLSKQNNYHNLCNNALEIFQRKIQTVFATFYSLFICLEQISGYDLRHAEYRKQVFVTMSILYSLEAAVRRCSSK